MILSKGFEAFIDDYCFTDSTVIEVKWDNNLLDLLVVFDYFWDIHQGKKESRKLTVRFQNCMRANFNMPNVFEKTPQKFKNMSQDELSSYIYGWYTITHYYAEMNNGLIDVSFRTVDENPQWLVIKCEEIWVEIK